GQQEPSGAREADVGQRIPGEGQLAQHDEEADESDDDADDGAGGVGVLHEVVLQRLGNHGLCSSSVATKTREPVRMTSMGEPYSSLSTSVRMISSTVPMAACWLAR